MTRRSPPAEAGRARRAAFARDRAHPPGFLRREFGLMRRRAYHLESPKSAQRDERDDPADVAQALAHATVSAAMPSRVASACACACRASSITLKQWSWVIAVSVRSSTSAMRLA